MRFFRHSTQRCPALEFVISSDVEKSLAVSSEPVANIENRETEYSLTPLDMTDKKPMRILSGIQPTGVLHIGNYFGMMKPAIALQAEGEALYFIADYHALTSVRDPDDAA